MKGLLTGIQMNFRAAMIIVGFAVLGTELYNPVVRNFFLKTSFKNLPLALELSAESLPLFIANIPEFKLLVRNPVSVFYQVISHADRRLAEIKGRNVSGKKIFIITGSLEEGKTTYTKKLIDILRKNKINVGGIIAERVMTNSLTTGYDIVNIDTGKREEFLRENTEGGAGRIGRFTISANGLAKGKKILRSLIDYDQTLVIIDEVGMLELQDNGWAESINDLLVKSSNSILMIVKDKYLGEVIRKWNLKELITFNIREIDYERAGLSLIEYINSRR
jgi:nucleoside-triphosphatase THEP1